MKIVFARPEMTCTGIESELGLAPGDIEKVTVSADGEVELEVGNDLTETQKTKFETLFGLTEKTV